MEMMMVMRHKRSETKKKKKKKKKKRRGLDAIAEGKFSHRPNAHLHSFVRSSDHPSQCCQMAKFDPFLSLDCAPTPSTLAQSKERKGSNFAIWQH